MRPAQPIARAGLASLLGLLGLFGCKTPHLNPSTVDEVTRRADARVREGALPSIVLAAVQGDDVLFVHASGELNMLEHTPATTDGVYMWFSISKVFTATAVMQLWDQGLVDLDAPVADQLPEFNVDEPEDDRITVRQLLNHSSGLANPIPFEWARPAHEARPNLEAFLASALKENPKLRFAPGAKDKYSNISYLALGRLIEVKSGQRYEDYVRQHILDPLDMHDTDFVYRAELQERAASGYTRHGNLLHAIAKRRADPRIFGPKVGRMTTAEHYIIDGASYGGLIGPAEELAHFLSMHLGNGEFRGRRILSEEAAKLMREKQTDDRGRRLRHCLGWHSDTIDGVRYFNHMGLGGGFRPAIRIYPDLNYGVVFLTNRTRYQPKPFTRTVVDPVRLPDDVLERIP